MRLEGFQESFENATVSIEIHAINTNEARALTKSLQSQFYAVFEVQLLGWVSDGYFVRSLRAISVEGETGLTVNAQQVPVNTSEALIAGFSSRGFATISVDPSSQVKELFD